MPLYLVRTKDFKETIDAVSPSRAACKAFHKLTKIRGNDEPIRFSVVTEGKRYAQCYDVLLETIEFPNEHEILHNIKRKARAIKCESNLDL